MASSKAALSKEAPEHYQVSAQELAYGQGLVDKYSKQINKLVKEERRAVHRVACCLSIAKHSKPEDVHGKLEHYLKWLVGDTPKKAALSVSEAMTGSKGDK